jgi:SAM-dependent methyltransferase
MSNRLHKLGYLISGATGRIGTRPACPSCGRTDGRIVSRKWLHHLLECSGCGLLHRYPVESAHDMRVFYDSGYRQSGLTTELPTDRRLDDLLASGFAGSEKDFSYHASVLEAVGVRAGERLLDYGANWGYASWQFVRRGFVVASYEVSKPRAAFGSKLGLTIHTDLAAVGTGFDAVYSSHVLEHTPDPARVLREQLSLVRPGGLVVGHTPNGSKAYRVRDRRAFDLAWGEVHPVMLTDVFVRSVAETRPCFISSNDRPEHVATWNRDEQVLETADESGLFFVIRRPQ